MGSGHKRAAAKRLRCIFFKHHVEIRSAKSKGAYAGAPKGTVVYFPVLGAGLDAKLGAVELQLGVYF